MHCHHSSGSSTLPLPLSRSLVRRYVPWRVSLVHLVLQLDRRYFYFSRSSPPFPSCVSISQHLLDPYPPNWKIVLSCLQRSESLLRISNIDTGLRHVPIMLTEGGNDTFESEKYAQVTYKLRTTFTVI